MNSFYGGKRGFGFTICPNSLNDGIWEDIGLKDDEDNLNTLYSGIKRGDLHCGEYALVTLNEDQPCLLYRIDETGNPIYVTEFAFLSAPGRAGKWFNGTEMEEAIDYNIVVEGSMDGDRYLNNENGNVWYLNEDTWIYECNIKGPPGDYEGARIRYGIPAPNEAGGSSQAPIYEWEDFHIETIADVSFDSISNEENGPDTVADYRNPGVCANAHIYDLSAVKDNKISIYCGLNRLPPLIVIPSTVSLFHYGLKMQSGMYLVIDGKLIKITTHDISDIKTHPFYGFSFDVSADHWITEHKVNGVEQGLKGTFYIHWGRSNDSSGIHNPSGVVNQYSSLITTSSILFYDDNEAITTTTIQDVFDSIWEFTKKIIVNAQASLTVAE